MLRKLLYAMLIGFIGVFFFALQNRSTFFSFFSFGIFIACASAMVGGLLGFLFGIPHTLQEEPKTTNSTGYRANTNLEQISDWLTKILVGVGLTQLNEMPTLMKKVSAFLAGGFGGHDSGAIALTILVFFTVCGFLFAFLWTRLFLAGEFLNADVKTHIYVLMKNQETKDAAALGLNDRQLNPKYDAPAIQQEQLNEAFKEASKPSKVAIFTQAEKIRSENWRNNKEIMERTIPIFRALIENDGKNEFHRNHAQLGYALKDQRNPDWAAAEQELTKAIEIRGNWKERGWMIYEFARAICRINQDKDFANGSASKPDARQKILNDLSIAAQSELRIHILGGLEARGSPPEIKKWKDLNGVSDQDIVS
jgi:hypothetical protein